MRYLLCLAALVYSTTGAALAQPATDYPSKPIRIMVSFSPGGSTDLLARSLVKHFSEAWKQSAYVENKLGAGGTIAMQSALSAPRDGYTLFMHSDGFAIAPALYKNLPFDTEKDFIPVALVARATNVLAVAADGPYGSLQDLVDAGRKTSLAYASAGVGSAQHMQGAKFSQIVQLKDPVHVPFKGTPEALNEVVAGRLDFVLAPMSNALPLLQSGKLKALATSGKERSQYLPDVPTVAELGYPEFAEEQWWGLFVPAGVEPGIAKKIEEETQKAMSTPEMQGLVKQLYSSAENNLYGDRFAEFVRNEIHANIAAAKERNISAN